MRSEDSDVNHASGTAGSGLTDVQMSMKGTEEVRWKTSDGRLSTSGVWGPGKQVARAAEDNSTGFERSTGGARKRLTQSLGGHVMGILVPGGVKTGRKVGAVEGESSEGRTPSDGIKLLTYNDAIRGSELYRTKGIQAGRNSTVGSL